MSTEDAMIKGMPLFGGSIDQWPMFYLKLKTFLESKRLLHLVEEVDATEGKSVLAKADPADDAMARIYILSRLQDAIAHIVSNCCTAREMIKTLKNHYEAKSAMSLLSKVDQLLDLKYKAGSGIAAHIGLVIHLANQIQSAGGLDLEKMIMVILLRSMPSTDEWRMTVGALKALSEERLTKDKVITVLTEADHSQDSGKKFDLPRDANRVFAARSNPEIVCFGCGKKGHRVAECRSGGKKWLAERGGSKRPQGENKGNLTFYTSLTTGHFGHPSVGSWIEDSGASRHYTGDRAILRNFRALNSELTIADGSKMKISGVGEVAFKSKLTSRGSVKKTLEFSLGEVYWVPGIVANLISTAELDAKGLNSITEKGTTTYLYRGRPVIESKKGSAGWVCRITPIAPREAIALKTGTTGVSEKIWHKRLCHIPVRSLKGLASIVDDLDVASPTGSLDRECEACLKGKMPGRSHVSSTERRTRRPLEIVHLDCIVVNNEGTGSEKYCHVLTDDFSKCRFAPVSYTHLTLPTM
jgi:hypothetical protein